jgi:predicted NBD/HSP70 family sugar kinase
VSPAEAPAQRRRLREFISLKLQFAMSESGQRPGAMVFALPAKLDDNGTPHGSNYAGMAGDRALLIHGLEQAGLGSLPLFVLNDAELAALSARLDERLAAFRKVLVLTLGFGIGAALIHRDA